MIMKQELNTTNLRLHLNRGIDTIEREPTLRNYHNKNNSSCCLLITRFGPVVTVSIVSIVSSYLLYLSYLFTYFLTKRS